MTDKKAESPVTHKLTNIRRDAEERDAVDRAARRGVSYADLRVIPVSIDAVKVIPKEMALSAKVAGLQIQNTELALAAYDPSTAEVAAVIADLKTRGIHPKIYVASLSGITEVWHFYDYIPASTKQITGKLFLGKEKIDDLTKQLSTFLGAKQIFESLDFNTASTTDLFDMFIIGSLSTKASDIHFEAEEKQARVRYRIDGLLHDVCANIPLPNYRNLLSRIKLLSGLKINVRDETQDGRFTIRLDAGKEIEVRVSIIPAEFGETVVMRILNPDSLVVDLTELGLRPDDLELITHELERPNGIILNTGPTGSGKTTTLYAFLRHVSNPENKVITIEDPIEYRIAGISQTQVDPEAGYTFASGLRSILRQDPDVILVGEIRDGETADIAMQAALTGHLVFSTLHTNDSIGAIPRLVDLGVRSATVGPAIAVVIAQRLVRRLCRTCRAPVEMTPELRTRLSSFLQKLPQRINRDPYQSFLTPPVSPVPAVSTDNPPGAPVAAPVAAAMYKAVGCSVCSGFGYQGRVAIFEFFRMTGEIEEAVLHSASEVVIRKLAAAQQMVTMQQDGILKALAGETSVEEVQEVTGPIVWS